MPRSARVACGHDKHITWMASERRTVCAGPDVRRSRRARRVRNTARRSQRYLRGRDLVRTHRNRRQAVPLPRPHRRLPGDTAQQDSGGPRHGPGQRALRRTGQRVDPFLVSMILACAPPGRCNIGGRREVNAQQQPGCGPLRGLPYPGSETPVPALRVWLDSARR